MLLENDVNKNADYQRTLNKKKAWSRAITVKGRFGSYCSLAFLPLFPREELWKFLLVALFVCSISIFSEKEALRKNFAFMLIGAIVSSIIIVLFISNFLIQLFLLFIFGATFIGSFFYFESEMESSTKNVELYK